MCEVLPKIWQGRIQKYWDKIMPNDYPHSTSVFALKFNSEEETAAVKTFESQLGTEESVVKNFIPEGCVGVSYIGTYEVTATPGVKTLLSPEKVTTDKIIALHYNTETAAWEKVVDAEVIDGYIWGTLDSFSPIAVVDYRKDIHKETGIDGLVDGTYIVCEGNIVKITEVDGIITLKSESTGTSIILDSKCYIIGGSIDGRHVDKTSITAIGINTKNIVSKIYGGSFYWSDAETVTPATVGEVNVNITDSIGVGCVTGSSGMVRTDDVNVIINNSKISWIGCGESWNTPKKKDANTPDCSFASLAWVKNAKFVLNNVISGLTYCSGNSGYLYVDHNDAAIVGGNHGYLISGGSNGYTKESECVVSDATVGIYQSTNRGGVGSAKASFTGCTVSHFFVGGDATDSTVTGTTDSIKCEINRADSDSYSIELGTQAGIVLTSEIAAAIVDSVKVSRSANVAIADDVVNVLGGKYIIK